MFCAALQPTCKLSARGFSPCERRTSNAPQWSLPADALLRVIFLVHRAFVVLFYCLARTAAGTSIRIPIRIPRFPYPRLPHP